MTDGAPAGGIVSCRTNEFASREGASAIVILAAFPSVCGVVAAAVAGGSRCYPGLSRCACRLRPFWFHIASSDRLECADRDIVTIGIPERKLQRMRVWIYSRLFCEWGGESIRTSQRGVEVVDAKEQKQSVARSAVLRARQRRVTVISPMMEAEKDSAILSQDLIESRIPGVTVSRVQQDPIPPRTPLHIRNPDNWPCSFHSDALGLTRPKISDRWRGRASLQVECGSHRKLGRGAASGSPG